MNNIEIDRSLIGFELFRELRKKTRETKKMIAGRVDGSQYMGEYNKIPDEKKKSSISLTLDQFKSIGLPRESFNEKIIRMFGWTFFVQIIK